MEGRVSSRRSGGANSTYIVVSNMSKDVKIQRIIPFCSL